MLFAGENGENMGNRRTKAIWSSLGKFGKKSFAPPKICLLLHLPLQFCLESKLESGYFFPGFEVGVFKKFADSDFGSAVQALKFKTDNAATLCYFVTM